MLLIHILFLFCYHISSYRFLQQCSIAELCMILVTPIVWLVGWFIQYKNVILHIHILNTEYIIYKDDTRSACTCFHCGPATC